MNTIYLLNYKLNQVALTVSEGLPLNARQEEVFLEVLNAVLSEPHLWGRDEFTDEVLRLIRHLQVLVILWEPQVVLQHRYTVTTQVHSDTTQVHSDTTQVHSDTTQA